MLDISRSLSKLGLLTSRTFPRVDYGGCGLYAFLVHKELRRRNIQSHFRMLESPWYTNSFMLPNSVDGSHEPYKVETTGDDDIDDMHMIVACMNAQPSVSDVRQRIDERGDDPRLISSWKNRGIHFYHVMLEVETPSGLLLVDSSCCIPSARPLRTVEFETRELVIHDGHLTGKEFAPFLNDLPQWNTAFGKSDRRALRTFVPLTFRKVFQGSVSA